MSRKRRCKSRSAVQYVRVHRQTPELIRKVHEFDSVRQRPPASENEHDPPRHQKPVERRAPLALCSHVDGCSLVYRPAGSSRPQAVHARVPGTIE